MPYAIPRLDGYPCFGLVTSFQPSPIPARRQLDSYFGIPGQVSLFGGALGYRFQIAGVLQDYDIASLNNDIAFLLSFVDANVHTLLDTSGNTWQNVQFDGEISFDPAGPLITVVGWIRGYSLQMFSLSP